MVRGGGREQAFVWVACGLLALAVVAQPLAGDGIIGLQKRYRGGGRGILWADRAGQGECSGRRSESETG